MQKIREFFSFLERLWYWIPILWKDRDWDYAHLYDMMRYKIHRMRNSIRKAKRHESWKRDVKNMSIAIELLRRVGDAFYYYDRYSGFQSNPKTRGEMAEHMKADRELLWKIMEKHSEQWWD